MTKPSELAQEAAFCFGIRCDDCADTCNDDADCVECVAALKHWALALDAFAARAVEAERQRCERIAADNVCGCGDNTAALIRADNYKGPTYRAIYRTGVEDSRSALRGLLRDHLQPEAYEKADAILSDLKDDE
jgi:hypothetical protein